MTVACASGAPKPMSHMDLKPTTAKADARVPYGSAPSQFAELWLPAGAGPHPVVALLHGGCWQADVAGLDIMDPMADDLRRRGYAVWNVEYRRLGEPGGGYPHTFQDVGTALDALRPQASAKNLDLSRLVLVGHSAGGHLAQWAAARATLPKNSPLRTTNPLAVSAVVSLGGLGDLEAAAVDPDARKACGETTIARLVNAEARADPFSDTSPARLSAPGVRQVLIHGELERVSPERIGRAYQAKAATRGESVEVRMAPGIGHFEPIAPETAAWSEVAALIDDLAGR